MKDLLSPTSKLRVYLVTALGTLACIFVAFAIDGYSMESGQWALGARWINNVLIPLVLAPPFFFFLLSKLRELSLAHRELLTIAATDPLTNCLNRRAFSTLVEAYLAKVEAEPDRADALLIVDVDHFKAVNDRFGHDHGDEALKLIADQIKSQVRELDLVARIGGEEFGVFLPGTDTGRTNTVAERIRSGVQAIKFAPIGEHYPLSLSIGGVTFRQSATYAELYRCADERLYAAKHLGRNRVVIDAFTRPILERFQRE